MHDALKLEPSLVDAVIVEVPGSLAKTVPFWSTVAPYALEDIQLTTSQAFVGKTDAVSVSV